jgi:hypothetical protein
LAACGKDMAMAALDDPFKRRILDALQREGRLTN